MRLRFLILFGSLVAVVLVIAGTIPARTQQPGGRPNAGAPGQGQGRQTAGQGQGNWGGGTGGGRANMLGDSNKLFDTLAQGQETLSIESTGMLQPMLTQFASQQGITSSTITRQQFAQFSQQMTTKLFSGDPDTKNMMGDVWKQMAAQAKKDIQDDPNGERAQKWAQFREYVRDNPDVKAALDKFREAIDQSKNGDPNMDLPPGLNLEELNKLPVVYRTGKLPSNMPAWFTQLDTDRDGQVGLYEWRHSGKAVSEFQLMDRNGDGLLTAEEVLYYLNNFVNLTKANRAGTLAEFKAPVVVPGSTNVPGFNNVPGQIQSPRWNGAGSPGKNGGTWNGAGSMGNNGGNGNNGNAMKLRFSKAG
jgi:hypothetical protein